MKLKIEDKIIGKRVLKSFGYTLLALIFAFVVIFSTFMGIFTIHSAEAQNIYLIISFFIVTNFIILLCTFSILDKLKK